MTPALFYLFLAVALIGTELLIMQLSVFWFMFVGLGALVATTVAWLSPAMSFTMVTLVFIVASLAVSAALYPLLKKWQNKPSAIAGNDAIGQSAVVTEVIEAGKAGKVAWSGSVWPAEVADASASFAIGSTVVISKLEGIRLIVTAKES